MKSIFGDSVQVCLFGESHSPAMGVVINGLAPGIQLDLDFLDRQLDKRRPKGRISTQRHETDQVRFLSGLFNGRTTGTPLCMVIENSAQKSGDYEKTRHLLRPSHADYTAQLKYLGCQDYRGGGHFSGRLTAPIVAAGAVALQILRSKGMLIGTHIQSLYGIPDSPFSQEEAELERQLDLLDEVAFPVLNPQAGERMRQAVEEAAAEGDSLGGVLETAVLHFPGGIGEPFFCSVESRLSQLLYSIPAVKGVEFGAGFGIAAMKGSDANDEFITDGKTVRTTTSSNGGINGGITNGMPLLFRCAVKPTPSIYKPQQTVDLAAMENAELIIQGRHDPAIIHRARVVADSMTALALLDLCAERFGYLWMGG